MVSGNRNALGTRRLESIFFYGYLSLSLLSFSTYWVCAWGGLGTVARIGLKAFITNGVTVFPENDIHGEPLLASYTIHRLASTCGCTCAHAAKRAGAKMRKKHDGSH
jgi:hypothetical protein